MGSHNVVTLPPSASMHTQEITEQDIIESYVYLLGRALAVRQEQMDLKVPGVAYNQVKYNKPRQADFVNPNLDVAYMEAWFAIDEHSAVILEMPAVKKRYYTVQLMDGWGEVLYNINERNFPDKPFGRYALCLANTKVSIPPDALKVIVPNKKIKMLARVELQNSVDEAVKLQKQFKTTVIGNPVIEPVPELPSFTNSELPDLSLFKFASALMQTPDAKMRDSDSIQNLCRSVSTFAFASSNNTAMVIKVIREKAIPRLLNYAINEAGKLKNNWLAVLAGGEYNGNYWTRTAANYVGIWANSTSEVIYFIAAKDDNGDTLQGGNNYVIHFRKEELPALHAKAFWSVILVDFPNYRVVPNNLKRYNLNNFSPFKYEADGSLKIYIGAVYSKKWPQQNWLPSPDHGSFNLTLRMYVPDQHVKDGHWFPAPIQLLAK